MTEKAKAQAAWLAVLLYAAGIFLLSSRPASEVPGWLDRPGADKLLHLALYCGLGWTYLRARHIQWGRASRRRYIIEAVLFCLFYGATDEFHQRFTPTREFDLLDLAADGSGGLGAAVLFRAKGFKNGFVK